MEVAGKTPEAHTTRRLGVASGTGGVQRGSRAAPPCEYSHGGGGKNLRGSRTTRRLGVASGAGECRGGAVLLPLANTCYDKKRAGLCRIRQTIYKGMKDYLI